MNDPFSLIGAPIKGEAVTAFVESFNAPVRNSGASHRKTVRVPSLGIEITASPEGMVHTVDLAVAGCSKVYPGPRPHGLDGATERADVEGRIDGEPNFTSEEHAAWDLEAYRLITMFDGPRLVRIVATTRR